ncbi:hypothetical protein ZEAMMB73_Zm00001d027697 [Zea mays]|uniref:Ubiquitin-like protease family profile domain-containing protein n=1 Tax=Zea mays TaxID=4577 RepID=A0A1D6JNV0_MAIZE|nr:hypothetical protein ZEAMMB73_Zm00001d027697 [Zea mays]
MFDTFNLMGTDQITMDIVVEEGNADVGNTVEPSYEVVARSGCSAQLSTNDTNEHELDIESEDSKVSVGNAAKQSHDVVGVGIDCIFNHVKVSTEADLGTQPDVIHLTSLDVPNESSQISSDADMVEQNKQDALDTLIRISQHKKPKKLNVARVVSEDYKCTPEDVQLIEYIKTLPGKQVVVDIDSAWLNKNDMECLFHGDIQVSGEALSAYIHCIRDEEHLLHREGGKVFLENTFISSLLKRDGDPKMLLNCKEDTIEKRVDNYLQSDMVDLKLISFLIYIEPYISPYVLPAKVTSTNTQELMFVLCTYIMGIDNAKYLKKHWIQSTKPYPISLSLQKLKDILDVNKPMDTDCFNMAVRMIACNDVLFLLEDKYHYMDLQFCSITKFGRDPRLRAKPDINMLAKLLECWLDMEYDVSDCKQILLPFSFMGHFTLYVLNMDTRSIYIMDSMPIPSWFKGDHPSMHYIHNIHYIANNMNAAMELANPTWKDDIYMWRRIVPTWVPRTLNWDLSGFLVINFMHNWNGIRLPCICTNGNDLRTKFLVELLKYKDNESKDNIPEEIQEIIRHIR